MGLKYLTTGDSQAAISPRQGTLSRRVPGLLHPEHPAAHVLRAPRGGGKGT